VLGLGLLVIAAVPMAVLASKTFPRRKSKRRLRIYATLSCREYAIAGLGGVLRLSILLFFTIRIAIPLCGEITEVARSAANGYIKHMTDYAEKRSRLIDRVSVDQSQSLVELLPPADSAVGRIGSLSSTHQEVRFGDLTNGFAELAVPVVVAFAIIISLYSPVLTVFLYPNRRKALVDTAKRGMVLPLILFISGVILNNGILDRPLNTGDIITISLLFASVSVNAGLPTHEDIIRDLIR
jgi:hypothetical protein